MGPNVKPTVTKCFLPAMSVDYYQNSYFCQISVFTHDKIKLYYHYFKALYDLKLCLNVYDCEVKKTTLFYNGGQVLWHFG